MATKILVVGCSFSNGHGLNDQDNGDCNKSDPKLWVNQVCNKVWPNSDITNLAKTGANNNWIFFETISALLLNEYDIVLVEWTAIPRFNIKVGLELYTVESMLNSESIDININNNITYTSKWLNSLGDNLRKIHNDHWDILDLVKYINVILQIHKGKTFFINGLAPWPDQYFTKKKIQYPSELSNFEQNMFAISTRDDDEIFALYEMVHNQYQQYGGVRQEHWLNLYSSLMSMQVDYISDTDLHPGYKSQDIFAEYLISQLRENN